MIQPIKINGLSAKNLYILLMVAVLLSDLAILLDIPFLRQIFGFLFLTFLPGILILQILKLNKIGCAEKVVLSVGISISFLMFFGLFLNNASLTLGYETPLSMVPLLISFNIAFVVLAIIGYKINFWGKNLVKHPITPRLDLEIGSIRLKNWLSYLDLTTSEKAFLTVPILFPALSIFGMRVMNTTDNNVILMFLYLLIPAYVIFVCIFNQKFSKRLYPVVIFLISISLLLMNMLRFSHIYGSDVHHEYYIFRMTLNNLHWSIVEYTILDACLSISLLPAIFQSIMTVNAQEYLFKGVFVSIGSFAPLVIYILAKRYIGELYAFFASFFFISQSTFLAGSTRTMVAIFFVALAVMILFNDEIEALKRRILFIVFIVSAVVSHYSTTYVFFFIMLFSWVAVETFSNRPAANKKITLTIVLIFFAFIFFWYSQITETAFNAGVGFFEETFLNLNRFFIAESRAVPLEQLVGKGLEYEIVSEINFFVTWGSFIFIGIGVLTMLKRYKERIAISNVELKEQDFFKNRFELEYLTMVLACVGIMILTVALPFISEGYSPRRLYSLMMIILSVCFVIGGITLSKQTFKKSLIKNFSFKKKALLNKKQKEGGNALQNPVRKSVGRENGSQVRAYLIILLILIPYFLMMTTMTHQILGVRTSITLNPVEIMHDMKYVHDQESYAAKWLKNCIEEKIALDTKLYYTTDYPTEEKLISQCEVPGQSINCYSFSRHSKIRGYLYLSYNNVVNDKFPTEKGTFNRTEFNRSDYTDVFVGKNEIYDNGGSEIWR